MNPNQFMHQNQILDGLGRSSDIIYINILNILICGWSRKTFAEHLPRMVKDDLGRSSETIQNLILMHNLIRNLSVSGSTPLPATGLKLETCKMAVKFAFITSSGLESPLFTWRTLTCNHVNIVMSCIPTECD